MSLEGNCSEIKRPGQFIDILIDDYFLRRPISIFDHDDDHVEILYRVVGGGTEALSAKVPGDVLDVLLPLGNGFDVSKRGERTLLVAGGIGMPPIHELSRELPDCKVLIGFRSADDMFCLDSFKALGIEPIVATEDGSFGIRGLVTDVMDIMKSGGAAKVITAGSGNSGEQDSGAADDVSGSAGEHGFNKGYDYDYVFCCGPEPMLKAVYERSPDGQFSFEERMGCGFGACMGCSCETKYGYKRICRDGPVLTREEIIW